MSFLTLSEKCVTSHQKPDNYDQPKLPYQKIILTAVQTCLNPHSRQQHQLISHGKTILMMTL